MKTLTGYMAGVNLGGWLSQYGGNLARKPDTHFDTFITRKDIAQIAAWGMDHVRVPIDYSLIEYDAEKGAYADLGFRYMDKLMDWCEEEKLNVVIDLHSAPGFFFGTLDENDLFDNPAQQDRYVDLWLTIVRRYQNRKCGVMFELLNEIVEPTPDRWNKLAERTVKAIRTVDQDHYIVVGGIDYNSPWQLQWMPIFDDDKVVYNFHMYNPHELTHLHASWAPEFRDYPTDFVYPSPMKPFRDFLAQVKVEKRPRYDADLYQNYTAMDRRYVRSFLRVVDEFLTKHDVPMYCGEYGVIENADPETRTNWTRDVSEFCVEHGIGRAFWTYRGMSFPIVDEEGNALCDSLIQAVAYH